MKTRTASPRGTKSAEPTTPPLAYSYIRFSTPDQAGGDSLRRQIKAAADWCKRNKVRLDTSLTLQDLGKSAFTGKHRENPDKHALATFLDLVERGRVPKGSYLIVESLDRLTREELGDASEFVIGLVNRGIKIVQLMPVEVIHQRPVDLVKVLTMVVELARGNSESRVKSERIREAWEAKREAARTTGKVATSWLPAWVERDGDALKLVPEKAAAIRRIFELAEAGYGHPRIVKTLTADGVPTIGRGRHWARTYVEKILSDRRVIGEYQPRDSNRQKVGDPIPGYYPAAITETAFLSVQAGMGRRKHRRGRIGGRVNIFAGLIRDARGGGNYCSAGRCIRGRRHWILIPTAAAQGRAKCHSFPLDAFERSVLEKLSEITVAEVFGDRDGPSPSAVLAGRVAKQEAAIAEVAAELHDGGHVASLAKVLREMEAKLAKLLDELALARAEEANPLAEQWGEIKTLADALDAAADPTAARLRLRSVQRRVVEDVFLLVTGQGRIRVAVAQFHFRGRLVRSYLVTSTPPAPCGGRGSKTLTPARREVRSIAGPGQPGGFDLRDAAQVAKLLDYLTPTDAPAGLPRPTDRIIADIDQVLIITALRAALCKDDATRDWALSMLADQRLAAELRAEFRGVENPIKSGGES